MQVENRKWVKFKLYDENRISIIKYSLCSITFAISELL